MHLTAKGRKARGCEMHQTSRGYYIMKKYILLFNIWESAFNLWKPGLFQKLFTYGCHDTERGQRTRVENRVHFGMHCVRKQFLGIAMAKEVAA